MRRSVVGGVGVRGLDGDGGLGGAEGRAVTLRSGAGGDAREDTRDRGERFDGPDDQLVRGRLGIGAGDGLGLGTGVSSQRGRLDASAGVEVEAPALRKGT